MPIFNKKVWKDFAAQYPNRRKLTQVDNDLYNVELAVGEIIEQGNKFEADQFNDLENRIENAFNNINDYIERAESAATEAESYRDDAETHKLKSEGYAVGTQNEIPVDSESPYFHNNSKYYSELTLGYKNESAEYSRNSATNAATASANASDAVSAKNAAISNKLMAEGFAIGTQNGVPVDPQSPYYHNNSKYYSEQTSKDDIRDIVNVYSAKNLLDYTEKCNTTTELSGIEFSILDDGSINASGTATSFVKFNLIDKGLTPDDTCIYIPNNIYSLSDVLITPGCRVEIGIAFYESGSITQHLYTINSNDGNRNITVNAINNDAYISLLDIQVDDETVLNNRVFKPMLRTASISDNTYVKYAMTNAELTKRHTIEGLNNTEIHDLEDGQTTVYNESSNKWENGYPNKVKLNKDEWGEVPGFDYYTNYYYDSNDNYTETDSQVTKISGSNPITETVQYNVPIGWSDMFIRIDDSIKLNEMVGKTIEFGAVTYEYTYQNENILSLKYSVNGEIFNVFSSETGQGSSDLLFNANGVAIQLVVPENCDYIEMHYISGNSTQVTTAGTATIGNVYAFDINENIIPDENNTSVEFNRYTNEPILLNDNSINFIKDNKEIVVVNNLGEKTVFGKNKNTESIDDIFNIYSSKNLLPFPYQDGDTKTVGGVTFEVSQKDYLATQSGYVCVTSAIRMYGTQTNTTEYVIYDQNSPYPLNKGNYKLVSRFIKQDIYGDQISGDIFITLEYYDGNTNTITVTNNNSGTFQINNSEQSGIKSIKLSTLNFTAPRPSGPRPMSRNEAYAAIMICSESVEDETYLPPTHTNFQLSKKIDNLTLPELKDTDLNNTIFDGDYLSVKDSKWISKSSKNLIPFPYYHTPSGILSVKKDGTIVLNGTSSGSILFLLTDTKIIPEDNYILSVEIDGTYETEPGTIFFNPLWNIGLRLGKYNSIYEYRDYEITSEDIPEGSNYYEIPISSIGGFTIDRGLTLTANSAVTYNNLSFKIMIRKSSELDTTYVRHTMDFDEIVANHKFSLLDDTNFVNLQEKQVPAWDSTNDEWYNVSLGTASELDVATSGDASTTQVVKGDDTRLTNARPASDVSAWAKESTKPSYTATEVGAIASTEKGSNNGVATLDSTGKVPSSQLPSYVDDVLEYEDLAHFPVTGETGKIYVAKDTNKQYRWSGSTYVEISESLALGETSSTAYAGNKGKANADNIATIQGLIPSSASTSNKLATSEDIPSLTNYVEKSSTSGLIKNDGTIDTNQYLTSIDISGKADKSEMSVTNGTGTDTDKVIIQLKSGTSATVLKSHQDVSSLQPKTLETPITVGGQSQTTVQNALSALASEDTGHVIEDESGTDMTQRTNLQFTGNVNVSDDNANNRTVIEILGGSSGGHVISDKSGTDMTQRNGLQFAGYLETTDDSANGRTVVSDAPNTVTYDTWVDMTPQQKSGKKWLITNAPGTPVNNLQPKTLDTPVVVDGQTQTTVQSALSALAASGGGGGGHTIEDSTGTAMTQRTNLKFTGATVTDDSTNNATIVSIPNMVVLSYGHSTWTDFINAYNSNTVVYCRASSNASNPGTGNQTRLAFMAYVNNESSPTEVEFQYYRSVGTKSASQQGDQVFVYKLNKQSSGAYTWSFLVRPTFTEVVSGNGVTTEYSNSQLKLDTPAIAPSFSTSTSYAVNDFVFYNGNLYKCTTAHSGAWDASHFIQTTIGAELSALLSISVAENTSF